MIDIKAERKRNAELYVCLEENGETGCEVDQLETIDRLLDELEQSHTHNAKLRATINQLQQELAARPER